MKKNLLLSAIALGIYYLLREIIERGEQKPAPPQKHLTTAFSKAKEHAVAAATE